MGGCLFSFLGAAGYHLNQYTPNISFLLRSRRPSLLCLWKSLSVFHLFAYGPARGLFHRRCPWSIPSRSEHWCCMHCSLRCNIEALPIRLLPGYPASLPGRVLTVTRSGSDPNTAGFFGPDTPVPGCTGLYPGTGLATYPRGRNCPRGRGCLTIPLVIPGYYCMFSRNTKTCSNLSPFTNIARPV